MAKNSNVPTVAPTFARPEGFRRLGSVANAGWFNQKLVGNTLYGVLEGMYERKDDLNPAKKSNFFQLRLLAPCEVREGRGPDAKVITVQAGEYVNLNYGPKSKDLEKLIPEIHQGAEYEVYAVVMGEKINLAGGRSMHNLDVQVKLTKAAAEIPADSAGDFSDESVM